jgi:hypothetical protein
VIKIINFKYKLNKYNTMINQFLVKTRKMFKKALSKIKFYLNKIWEKILLLVLNIMKLIINTDISFIFLFFATYLINYTYPWYYRLIGSLGLWVIYKNILKDFRR